MVDLRVDGEHLLHFGGGLSCVLAQNGTRSSAAHAIAYTIVGPRPTGASGAIDIGGMLVSVWSLPSPMLPHDAPVVVGPDLVRAYFAASMAPLRMQLAAAHGECALDRQRVAAELAALGVDPTIEAVLAEEPEPEVDAAPVPGDTDEALSRFMAQVQTYGDVESLVAALEPEPMPEAMQLAELVEANVAMTRARAEVGDDGPVDVDAAERRVKLARIEVAMASGAVGPEARYEIERRHRAVVEAEAHLSEVGRRRRPRAVVRYDAAVAAEQKALGEAGIDSYAMFLLALTSGDRGPDERALKVAQDELTAATAAYEHARQLHGVPANDELAARALLLRDHARALLGREPGRDVASELRTVRVPRADQADRLHDLTRVLAGAGVQVGDDPLSDARRFLMSPPSIHIEQRKHWPMPGARWAGRIDQSDAFAMPGTSRQPVRELMPESDPAPPKPESRWSPVELARIEVLEREGADKRDRLAALEAAMRELDSMCASELSGLSPSAFTNALASTLDAYRAGAVLAGRVPLVLDGVLDRISAETCDAAVDVLAAASDLQTIVVSNEAQVMVRVRDAGGTIVHWPEAEHRGAAQFTA